ncbi:MAG: Gfo/Idh/MocA family oxidoreductase [candidate division WOR-3 bacterium]
MRKLKIGIVGFGNWGKKIYQTLKSFSGCEIVAICDKENINLNDLNNLNEKIIITNDCQDLIKMKLDAVIIATPNDTHYHIAHKFLSSGINLFVEKPLATSYKEVLSLISLAKRKNLNIFTGHILLYHPLVMQFKRYLTKEKSWELKILRTNNFLTTNEPKDLLYDFGPHDIGLILFFFGEKLSKKNLEISKGTINFNFSVQEEIHIFGVWGKNDSGKERKIIAKSNGKEIIFDDNLTILKFIENKKEKMVKRIDRRLPLYWELKFFLDSLINKNIKESVSTEKIMKIIDELERLL